MNIRKVTMLGYSSFSGMTLNIVERQSTDNKKGFRHKYAAANDGPVFWVDHYKDADGKVTLADQRARVANALSAILGIHVCWSADRGYSDRASGAALKWDRQRQRFIVIR